MKPGLSSTRSIAWIATPSGAPPAQPGSVGPPPACRSDRSAVKAILSDDRANVGRSGSWSTNGIVPSVQWPRASGPSEIANSIAPCPNWAVSPGNVLVSQFQLTSEATQRCEVASKTTRGAASNVSNAEPVAVSGRLKKVGVGTAWSSSRAPVRSATKIVPVIPSIAWSGPIAVEASAGSIPAPGWRPPTPGASTDAAGLPLL